MENKQPVTSWGTVCSKVRSRVGFWIGWWILGGAGIVGFLGGAGRAGELGFEWIEGRPTLVVRSGFGTTNEIQSAEDLGREGGVVWRTESVLEPIGSEQIWRDPAWTGAAQRYYRVVTRGEGGGLAVDRELRLEGGRLGRVFEGIGAASAGASSRHLIEYPEKQRSEVLDLLFQPRYGAGFQHLKVEIGGDVNSTDGVEPSHMRTRDDENYHRGYEWWLMKEAKRRHPGIYLDALQWGAPAWIGGGKFFSQDNIDYVIRFLLGAERVHGLRMDYVGIWNERGYEIPYIKQMRRSLDEAGLGRVQIVAADDVISWKIAEDVAADAELAKAVGVIGVHYPSFVSTAVARGLGKPLWSSEDGPWRGDWTGAKSLARMYNRNYVEGRMTKTIIWSPVTSYYDNLPLPGSGVMRANTPWSGAYEVQPALWVTAHTTQFAEPGWVYLDGDGVGYLPGGGSVVTLKDGKSGEYSMIIETMFATRRQRVVVRVGEGLSRKPVAVWRTTRDRHFERVGILRAEGGVFDLVLEADAVYSVTTTEGQRKGAPVSPPSAPFPVPYVEGFEGYELGAMPRYWSDQAGWFEVVERGEGEGRMLRQVIPKKGIEWQPMGEPRTILGDVGWRDYEIRAEGRIEGTVPANAYVALYGRVGEVKQNADPLSAYSLRAYDTGIWELRTPSAILAAGNYAIPAGGWIRLGLKMRLTEIEASIGGEVVARVNDLRYSSGLAGLGSGWHGSQFDTVEIRMIETPPNLALAGVATASSVWSEDYAARMANDGQSHTRWNGSGLVSPQEWLEIDWGAPTTFNTAVMRQFDDRILEYRIQYWTGSEWRDAFSAGRMGEGSRTDQFGEVTASKARLLITSTRESPSLWEFELYRR